jgi:hypothetical protein
MICIRGHGFSPGFAGLLFHASLGVALDVEFPTYDSMTRLDLHFVWYSFSSVVFCWDNVL